MATIEVTSENHDALIADNDIVVLDFWASWCGPCKRFAPIFEAASETHGDVAFGKINTEAEQQLAGRYGIRSIPTTVFYREGVPIHMQPGLLPPEGLEDLITQVRALDMDVVRAEMAAAQSEES
ncbi:MAG: thioredoxin [Myxococcota bacterium]